jgi:succinylglutamic semialdehyde dehydrogenase
MNDVRPIRFLGDYINGKFVACENPDIEWEINSPADLKDKIIKVGAKFDHVDTACDAAKRAYLPWARLGLEGRKPYLLRLKEVFAKRGAEVAELIARETGKPLWESKTEAAALMSKIDITLSLSMKLVETEEIKDALPGINGYTRFNPRGVMAVLGPFNFPAHLPNGHIIPALACGNTVVFKPSEKTSAVGQWMAECYHQAEFPAGVFNLVQGVAETGKRLSSHDHVDGILFTGSYEVGLKIKQDTMTHFWKVLALEMGGKNATIVWKDADLKKAVYESLIGAFMSSGQRCACTSRLLLHKDIRDEFLEQFYAGAKRIKIGHWKDDVFMGPLISADAVEKYIRFQEIAKREGAESLMRGKALNLEHDGYYVTPSINIVQKYDSKSVYQKSEIFGPNVAVYTVEDFDEAMMINGSTGFGLSGALFTKDRTLWDRAILEARCGVLNWNRTTNGASSKLPFGGLGKSGNDRPSGAFAVEYCSVPIASLEDMGTLGATNTMPGLQFEWKE